jgi:hypothetical protein
MSFNILDTFTQNFKDLFVFEFSVVNQNAALIKFLVYAC